MGKTKRLVEDQAEGLGETVKSEQKSTLVQARVLLPEVYAALMRYVGSRPIDEAGAVYSSLSSLPTIEVTVTENGAA
jgi:hypothetical protein